MIHGVLMWPVQRSASSTRRPPRASSANDPDCFLSNKSKGGHPCGDVAVEWRDSIDHTLRRGRGSAEIGIGETSSRINLRCAGGVAGKIILPSDPPHSPSPWMERFFCRMRPRESRPDSESHRESRIFGLRSQPILSGSYRPSVSWTLSANPVRYWSEADMRGRFCPVACHADDPTRTWACP
jgi:hypothetical protein